MLELYSASGEIRFDEEDGMAMTLSIPKCSTFSSSFKERRAFFSRCNKALRFLTFDGPGSGESGRVGEELSGELQGVTVGEKFCPVGVLRQLGVMAFIPLSFSTEARPKLTE